MILYIGTDTYEQYRKNTNLFNVRNILEDIAGDACVVLHYSQVNLSALAQIRPWAICHSGTGTDYDKYDVLQHSGYVVAVKECDIAQIGFCGGHQIIATFFGSRLGPMGKLKPNEADPSPYHPGYSKEWGVYPVRIVKADPLFRGLGKLIRVQEYHYWEVKRLGRELELLASSRDCDVQAFRHRTKLVYGTQFHPEVHSDAYPDGAKILENFFRIARKHAESSSGETRRQALRPGREPRMDSRKEGGQ